MTASCRNCFQRNVGERDPRRDHLFGALGRDPGQAVARARRRGLGQEIAQIGEDIGGGIDGVAIDHGGSGPPAMCDDLRQTISPKAGGPEGMIVCKTAVFWARLPGGYLQVPNYQTVPDHGSDGGFLPRRTTAALRSEPTISL